MMTETSPQAEDLARPRLIDIWPGAAKLFGIKNRSSAYQAAAAGFFGPLVATGVRRKKVSLEWIERKLRAAD